MLVRFFSFAILLVFLVQLSCGKVVQEAQKDDENPSFSFSYSVETVPTKNIKLNPQAFTTEHSPLYVLVQAIKDDGAVQDESWGKSVLLPTVVSVPMVEGATDNVIEKTVFVSTAFRPDGVSLSSPASHGWSKLIFDDSSKKWSGESVKIERGFPFYKVVVYDVANHYRMRIVNESLVSKNVVVPLGNISEYDTFLGALFSTSMQVDQYVNTVPGYFIGLSQFYDPVVFTLLNYSLPSNLTKKFNFKKPHFVFNDEFSVQLLVLYDLYRADVDEAESFIKSAKYPWLTKQLRKYLLDHIKQLQEEVERLNAPLSDDKGS